MVLSFSSIHTNYIEQDGRRFFEKNLSRKQGTRKSARPILKEISLKKKKKEKEETTLRQIQRGWRVTMLAKDVYIRREHGCNDAFSVTMHRYRNPPPRVRSISCCNDVVAWCSHRTNLTWTVFSSSSCVSSQEGWIFYNNNWSIMGCIDLCKPRKRFFEGNRRIEMKNDRSMDSFDFRIGKSISK